MRQVSFEEGFAHEWPREKLKKHFDRLSLKRYLSFLSEIDNPSDPESTFQVLVLLLSMYLSRNKIKEAKETVDRIKTFYDRHSQVLSRNALELFLKPEIKLCYSFEEYELGLEIAKILIQRLSRNGAQSTYALIHTFAEAGELCRRLAKPREALAYFESGRALAEKQIWERGNSSWFEEQIKAI